MHTESLSACTTSSEHKQFSFTSHTMKTRKQTVFLRRNFNVVTEYLFLYFISNQKKNIQKTLAKTMA
jgi:hypothetical protein